MKANSVTDVVELTPVAKMPAATMTAVTMTSAMMTEVTWQR
ncbi:hypothetical protein [Corynebacterium sp. MNWGS58]